MPVRYKDTFSLEVILQMSVVIRWVVFLFVSMVLCFWFLWCCPVSYLRENVSSASPGRVRANQGIAVCVWSVIRYDERLSLETSAHSLSPYSSQSTLLTQLKKQKKGSKLFWETLQGIWKKHSLQSPARLFLAGTTETTSQYNFWPTDYLQKNSYQFLKRRKGIFKLGHREEWESLRVFQQSKIS